MAYIIHRNEPAATAISRVMLEQNRRALALLSDVSSDPAARIHRSRQCFKRMRGAIRLVRRAAPYVCEVENRFYRDIARRLSHVRDTAAIVEAIGALETTCVDPALRESLAMLKTGFAQRAGASQAEYITGLEAGPIPEICSALSDASDRLTRLPLDGLRRRDLKRAARRTVRKCARIFDEVSGVDDPAAFHAWRKHVKAAHHHARLMRELRPNWARRREGPLRELGELLGQMQNLFVLKEALRSQPDELGIDIHLRRLRRTIEISHADLRNRATLAGNALFGSGIADGEPEVIRFPVRNAG